MGEGAGVRRGGEGVFFSRAEKNQKGEGEEGSHAAG